MSEFVFLFRDGQRLTAPAEIQAHMQKWGAWMNEMKAKGQYKSGQPLERTGTIVRGRKKAITDGPFAEAKDLVGGFMLIVARDLDEAVEISKGCPIFETDGAVEVRPVMIMKPM